MGCLHCSRKMSGNEEKSIFKNEYFAHYRLSFKHYITQVDDPESYDFSGFLKFILTGFGAEFREISWKQNSYQ
jgi:hypothetical protein